MFKYIGVLIMLLFGFSPKKDHQFCVANPLIGDVTPAQPEEYTFVVSIAGKNSVASDNPYGHVCAGSLIKNNYVLTAAHCYMEENETKDDYWVLVGSNDLESSKNVAIKDWITFEQWNSNKPKSCRKFSDNDISLIKLNQKVTAPVAKIAVRILPTSWIGKEVTSVSWMISDSATTRYMQKANLRVLSLNDCKRNIFKALGEDIDPKLEANTICTNHTPFVILHEGDSGSPIFVEQAPNVYEIIGVNTETIPLQEPEHRHKEQNLHISPYYYKKFIKEVAKLEF